MTHSKLLSGEISSPQKDTNFISYTPIAILEKKITMNLLNLKSMNYKSIKINF